jgi:hypothetical protein
VVYAIYALALLFASLVTFGAGGLIPAAGVLVIWAIVFASNSRPRTLVLLVLPLSVAACCLLMPGLGHPRAIYDRMDCSNNLKQIALAMHNYGDTYKSLPPAFLADEDGKPMHSWRVLILPFLEPIEASSLYEEYSFDEPWDGPANSKLAERMPAVYACRALGPRQGGSVTNYVAVVGDRTAWPGERSTHFRDFADGTSNTLLLMESDSRSVNWLEPRDVSYDEALQMLSLESGTDAPHRYEDFLYIRHEGRNMAMADASIRLVPAGLPSSTARSLLLRDDAGPPLDQKTFSSERRLRTGNCIRLAIFILIALWPLPWVWIHPRGVTPTSPREPSQAQ